MLTCRTKSSTSTNIPVAASIRNTNIYMIPFEKPLPYSIEVETKAGERVVCNGETYGEFTWGATRYTRWETVNPVDTALCIIGSIKPLDIGTFTVVAPSDNSIDDRLLDVAERALLLIKGIEWPVFRRYLVLDKAISEHVGRPIAGAIRALNDDAVLHDIVYSTLVATGASRSSYSKWFVDNVVKTLKGIQSVLSFRMLVRLKRTEQLRQFIEKPKECIEVTKRRGNGIMLRNTCNTRLLVSLLLAHAFIERILEPGETVCVSSDGLGCLKDYASLKLG